jgi:hypothetical protein
MYQLRQLTSLDTMAISEEAKQLVGYGMALQDGFARWYCKRVLQDGVAFAKL